MLVLSRKVGQRIRIGKDVTITVVRITGGGVRLGIDAPMELPVIREELLAELDGVVEESVADGKVSIEIASNAEKSDS